MSAQVGDNSIFSLGLGSSLLRLPLRGNRFELHLVHALCAVANEIELMDTTVMSYE